MINLVMGKNDIKSSRLKPYLLALFIISSLFLSAGFLIGRIVNSYVHEQRIVEAKNLSESSSSALKVMIDANQMIENLFEEKLQLAAKIMMTQKELSNESLQK